MYSEVTTSPTLWAGTNSGQVLAFVLTFSKNEEKRKEDKVEVSFVQYFWKIHLTFIKFSKHFKNYLLLPIIGDLGQRSPVKTSCSCTSHPNLRRQLYSRNFDVSVRYVHFTNIYWYIFLLEFFHCQSAKFWSFSQ